MVTVAGRFQFLLSLLGVTVRTSRAALGLLKNPAVDLSNQDYPATYLLGRTAGPRGVQSKWLITEVLHLS